MRQIKIIGVVLLLSAGVFLFGDQPSDSGTVILQVDQHTNPHPLSWNLCHSTLVRQQDRMEPETPAIVSAGGLSDPITILKRTPAKKVSWGGEFGRKSSGIFHAENFSSRLSVPLNNEDASSLGHLPNTAIIIFSFLLLLVFFRTRRITRYARNLGGVILLVAFAGNGYAQPQQIFNASATFTVPAGVTSITVECWGGGGAGGGNTTNKDGGGGGGGGAYSKTTNIAVTPGATYTVTVGAGGTGSSGNGGNGGNSWFNTTGTILATGGFGGFSPSGTGGVSGTGGLSSAGVGFIKYSGGTGGTGGSNNSGQGGPGGSSAGTGANGTSGSPIWSTETAAAEPIGGGIGGNGGTDGNIGLIGAQPGGGGGGAGEENNGGNGADGKVIITWSCPTNAGILSGIPSICMGMNTTFTSDVVSGVWSSANTNIATINAITGSITTIAAGGPVAMTYTVARSGCPSQTATRDVTVNPIPTVNTPSAQTFCHGLLTTQILLTGSPSVVVFDIIGGATIGLVNLTGVTSIPSFTPIAGSATITITPRANGCSGTPVTYSITVNRSPTISVQPVNQSTCAGNSVTFSATASGTPAPTYQWRKGGIDISGALLPSYAISSILASDAGNYDVVITNICGAVTSNSVNLTIADIDKPVISGCPTNIIQTVASGQCSKVVSWIEPTATDNCTVTGSLVWAKSHIPGSTFNLGSTIVTYTATDEAGNISNVCSFTITISDIDTPNITCPPDITHSVDAGTCSYTANIGTPITNSNCGVPAVVGTRSDALALNAPYPVGTTIIEWVATFAGNNKASCTQIINVTDSQIPVFTSCPGNITAYTGAGRLTCDQVISWIEPTATDNCTAAGSLVWTKSHIPGNTFPVGTTTVSYTVKNAANNTATCSFDVIVIDNTKPIFNVPGPSPVNIDASCNLSVLPAFTGNITGLFDNCTIPANLVVTYTDGPSTPTVAGCNYPYSFTRTWKVTDDAGNFEEKTQVITVRDMIKPVISIPPYIALSCAQGTLPAVAGTATATDNCLEIISITYSDITTSGGCAGNSIITRTWTAQDCSGNKTTGIQQITVSDEQKPIGTIPNKIATCPATIPLPYANYAEFAAAGGTASDNCGAVTVTLNNEIANGLAGKPGYCPTSITRVYRITDQCTNYIDLIQTITVEGECGCSPCANATFRLADFLGNPSGTIVFDNLGRSGNCCPDGESNCVSFNVRLDNDAVGIEILIDGATPSPQDWRIDCDNITMNNSVVCIPGGKFYLFTFCKPGTNTNKFTFRSVPGIISSGDITTRVECSGQITTSGIVSDPQWTSIWPGTPGQYNSYLSSTTVESPTFTPDLNAPPEIKYKICGKIAATVCNVLGSDCDTISIYIKQPINLTWNNDPTIVCKNNIPTLVANVSPAGATYTYEWYNGSGALGTPVYTGTNSYKPETAGLYSIKVTDTQNGIPCSSAIFNFEVKFDLIGAMVFSPPPGDLTIQCGDSNASQLIQDWLASASAIDEAGNPLFVHNNYIGITEACGTALPVTFDATDHCGNIGTAIAHIFIKDAQAPTWLTAVGTLNRTISCSDAPGLTSAQTLVPVPTDLCDPTLILTKTTGIFVAGSCSNSGTYTNTWTATDDCENVSAVFTQVITIQDTQAPTWTTNATVLNVTLDCSDVASLATAQASVPLATDNCDAILTPVKVPGSFIAGSCPQTGTYTNTWTVTDECGNVSAVFTQVITLQDLTAPVISCPGPVTGIADNSSCFATGVLLGTATATDNCSATVITNNAPVQFPVGVTNVTWTATDACGNTATCTQIVTITDNNQPPTISCPLDVEEQIAANLCSKTNVTIGVPNYSDNCPGSVLSYVVTGATTGSGTGFVPPAQAFNIGISTVTYTVTEVAGLTASCSFTVTIKRLDIPPAVITCPPNPAAVDAIAGTCFAPVTVAVPLIVDPCVTATYTIINSYNNTANASGSYPVGETSVIWTITDNSGIVKNCTQTVTVTDNEPPTFTAPDPFEFCVENLLSAAYAYNDLNINPDPDYYMFMKTNNFLDLDPSILKNNFKDNCCTDDFEIHWSINFTAIPNPAYPDVPSAPAMLTHSPITDQTGQPSLYTSDILFPGDGVTFAPVIHTITYWLIDCNGKKSDEKTVNITIKPRPHIIKTTI